MIHVWQPRVGEDDLRFATAWRRTQGLPRLWPGMIRHTVVRPVQDGTHRPRRTQLPTVLAWLRWSRDMDGSRSSEPCERSSAAVTAGSSTSRWMTSAAAPGWPGSRHRPPCRRLHVKSPHTSGRIGMSLARSRRSLRLPDMLGGRSHVAVPGFCPSRLTSPAIRPQLTSRQHRSEVGVEDLQDRCWGGPSGRQARQLLDYRSLPRLSARPGEDIGLQSG